LAHVKELDERKYVNSIKIVSIYSGLSVCQRYIENTKKIELNYFIINIILFMNKFYKKIKNDLITTKNKHESWIKIRDEYINNCKKYNIEWEKVKDAFILEDENMEKYLWENFNNEFLSDIKNFINKQSPNQYVSIYSNPIKNFDNFNKSRKRILKYKKYKLFESYNNIRNEFDKKGINIMIFNKYHNDKNIIELQFI